MFVLSRKRPPALRWRRASDFNGVLAQLGERLICIQEVRSSILLGSTKTFCAAESPCATAFCVAKRLRHPDQNSDHMIIKHMPMCLIVL